MSAMTFAGMPSAYAQTFVCPNGPGPGEVQVGTTGGSGGIAVIPICASNGEAEPDEAEAPPPPPIQAVWVDSHIAIAWHGSSKEVWATWGHRDLDHAKTIVMDACNATMGGECEIAEAGYNIAIAIFRDKAGRLHTAWGKDEAEAQSIAQSACKSDGKACKILHVYVAKAWREPAEFGDLERKIADDAGIYQQYAFPKNSRIAPPAS